VPAQSTGQLFESVYPKGVDLVRQTSSDLIGGREKAQEVTELRDSVLQRRAAYRLADLLDKAFNGFRVDAGQSLLSLVKSK